MSAGALPVAALAGFTVDDAWIVARVAAHLAAGHGQRFNVGDAPVDAVTPLGFAHLLAPAATAGPLTAFHAARLLGVVAWLGAVAWAGGHIGAALARSRDLAPGGRDSPWGPWRVAAPPLLVLAACPTLGAWASAGLETGAIMALGLVAALGGRGAVAAAALAAAWRPELLPWAVVLGVARELPRPAFSGADGGAASRPDDAPDEAARGGTTSRDAPARDGAAPDDVTVRGVTAPLEAAARSRLRRALIAALVPLAAALCVAGVRALAFGAPLPLAALAKPSDAATGLRYLWGAVAFTGPPLLALAPLTWRRLSAVERAPLWAAAAHGGALVAAGGDWMPLYRLAAPALPGLLLVALAVGREAALGSTALRTALALGGALALGLTLGPDSRAVLGRRLALVQAARPALVDARSVATLDVGWVSLAASPGATIADLAGVTDRRVAVLRGGHTSKVLPEAWLERRGSDALVVLLAPGAPVDVRWWESRAARAVEERLLGQAGAAARWQTATVTTVALPGTDQRYLIARRSEPAP